MNRRICVILGFALAAFACGNDGEGIDLGPDAAGGGGPVCDPLEQTGCESGEKCASRIESLDPFSATADCVPDGSGAAGEACAMVGAPEDGEGYDDCRAGLTCQSGRCTPICDAQVAGGCEDTGGFCVAVGEFFEPNIGVCADACDPVAQNCEFPDDEGGDGGSAGACYFHPSFNDGVCLTTSEDAVRRVQGDECLGTGGGPGYINGCAEGHGCWLPVSQSLWTCTFFCEPTGDFDGEPCAARGGPGAAGYECRYLNGWLGYDTPEVPESLGVCLPTDLDGLTPCADDPGGPGCEYQFPSHLAPRAAAPHPIGAL